jgi:hypothetical protein
MRPVDAEGKKQTLNNQYAIINAQGDRPEDSYFPFRLFNLT